jgi:hypothetical protein
MIRADGTTTVNIPERKAGNKELHMLGIILVAVLTLALLGALPRWTHSRDWGYYPTGGVGVILFVVVILLILGRV